MPQLLALMAKLGPVGRCCAAEAGRRRRRHYAAQRAAAADAAAHILPAVLVLHRVYGTSTPYLASGVLGHRDERIYNRARSLHAFVILSEIIEVCKSSG